MIMSQGYINGLRFAMDSVPVTVQKGTVEVWNIINSEFGPGGMPMGMMSMPHPLHLHCFQFQVLKRLNHPRRIRDLAIDFSHDFTGTQRYLFHWHNLEHSDGGMMINYEVEG
ncbi:MAG: multicopper oxidase domain-containing protein [Pseudomonadota bacterium]